MDTTDDRSLIRAWAEHRSEPAFTELMRRHAAMVRETCRRRLGAPDLAEDATQAVFIILARRAPDLAQERWWSRPVIADWLFRTTQHVCANLQRERRRRRHHEQEAARQLRQEGAPPMDDGDERMMEAVDALPNRYRTVVVLHYLEGRPREEVARTLQVSLAAVHKRVERALALLRRRLGNTATAHLLVSAAGHGEDNDAVARLHRSVVDVLRRDPGWSSPPPTTAAGHWSPRQHGLLLIAGMVSCIAVTAVVVASHRLHATSSSSARGEATPWAMAKVPDNLAALPLAHASLPSLPTAPAPTGATSAKGAPALRVLPEANQNPQATADTGVVTAVHGDAAGQQDLVVVRLPTDTTVQDGCEFIISRDRVYIVTVRAERVFHGMVSCHVLPGSWNIHAQSVEEGDLATTHQ